MGKRLYKYFQRNTTGNNIQWYFTVMVALLSDKSLKRDSRGSTRQ